MENWYIRDTLGWPAVSHYDPAVSLNYQAARLALQTTESDG